LRPELRTLAAGLAAREERFALVTVVRREPPSSAQVGDVALVTERGEYHGWAGGGCTRSSVLREAMRAIADGQPRLLSLSPEPEGGQRNRSTDYRASSIGRFDELRSRAVDVRAVRPIVCARRA
jgi:xanthine dehydrogenase accessory factor